jgi:hypothetical protein
MTVVWSYYTIYFLITFFVRVSRNKYPGMLNPLQSSVNTATIMHNTVKGAVAVLSVEPLCRESFLKISDTSDLY